MPPPPLFCWQCGPTETMTPSSQPAISHLHQTPHTLAIDKVAMLAQRVDNSAASEERMLKVQLIDETHQLQVFTTYRPALVVRR